MPSLYPRLVVSTLVKQIKLVCERQRNGQKFTRSNGHNRFLLRCRYAILRPEIEIVCIRSLNRTEERTIYVYRYGQQGCVQ